MGPLDFEWGLGLDVGGAGGAVAVRVGEIERPAPGRSNILLPQNWGLGGGSARILHDQHDLTKPLHRQELLNHILTQVRRPPLRHNAPPLHCIIPIRLPHKLQMLLHQ
jgi:hypothetical protein